MFGRLFTRTILCLHDLLTIQFFTCSIHCPHDCSFPYSLSNWFFACSSLHPYEFLCTRLYDCSFSRLFACTNQRSLGPLHYYLIICLTINCQYNSSLTRLFARAAFRLHNFSFTWFFVRAIFHPYDYLPFQFFTRMIVCSHKSSHTILRWHDFSHSWFIIILCMHNSTRSNAQLNFWTWIIVCTMHSSSSVYNFLTTVLCKHDFFLHTIIHQLTSSSARLFWLHDLTITRFVVCMI